MDLYSLWIVVLLIIISSLVTFSDSQDQFFCFKKIHNAPVKDGPVCRGLMNKLSETGAEKSFKSPRGCCRNGGRGYARQLETLGKRGKKYRCEICTHKQSNSRRTTTAAITIGLLKPTGSTTGTITTTAVMSAVTSPAPNTKDLFVTSPGQYGWTRWGTWSECSLSCGIGVTRRQRLCLSSDDCGGETETETDICVVNTNCPVNGGWGPWSKYSECPITCGGGNVTRERKCNLPEPKFGGLDCEGEEMEAIPCNINACPVDGAWSEWTTTGCSVSCGVGRMYRNRSCSDPEPQYGGITCQGVASEYFKCELPRCPVDGGWSLWSSWGDCNTTCGNGIKTRTRACIAPRPKRGGADCEGETTQEGICFNIHPCPVDGDWSPWSVWGPCLAKPCTGERGNTTRRRTCSNPLPQYGGSHCAGHKFENQPCLNNEQCPVDGDWCGWGEYTTCLPHDTGEFKLRTRQCGCPSPESGGLLCPGIDFDIVKCLSSSTASPVRCRSRVPLVDDDDDDDLEGSGGLIDENC